jgi:hypothetical protein
VYITWRSTERRSGKRLVNFGKSRFKTEPAKLALIVFHQFLSVLLTIMYLVRFWDFSEDFFLFLMKCTKIFRVIYPSMRININLNYHLSYQLICTILGISKFLLMYELQDFQCLSKQFFAWDIDNFSAFFLKFECFQCKEGVINNQYEMYLEQVWYYEYIDWCLSRWLITLGI